MSSQSNDFEQELNELMQQRKRKIKAPTSIKRNVLARARSKMPNGDSSSIQGLFAAAATLLIVFGLLEFSVFTNSSDEQLAVIEYHQMYDEHDDSRSEQYAVVHQQYSESVNLMAKAARLTSATVSALDNGELQLITCNDTKVQLSKNLLQHLQRMHQIKPDLKVGEAVMLATTEQGLIINISSIIGDNALKSKAAEKSC
ncbi:MAG: hypothetical protein ACFHVJ_11435 [Aestuariibacter sp.]